VGAAASETNQDSSEGVDKTGVALTIVLSVIAPLAFLKQNKLLTPALRILRKTDKDAYECYSELILKLRIALSKISMETLHPELLKWIDRDVFLKMSAEELFALAIKNVLLTLIYYEDLVAFMKNCAPFSEFIFDEMNDFIDVGCCVFAAARKVQISRRLGINLLVPGYMRKGFGSNEISKCIPAEILSSFYGDEEVLPISSLQLDEEHSGSVEVQEPIPKEYLGRSQSIQAQYEILLSAHGRKKELEEFFSVFKHINTLLRKFDKPNFSDLLMGAILFANSFNIELPSENFEEVVLFAELVLTLLKENIQALMMDSPLKAPVLAKGALFVEQPNATEGIPVVSIFSGPSQ
jgi:hypothetical protein